MQQNGMQPDQHQQGMMQQQPQSGRKPDFYVRVKAGSYTNGFGEVKHRYMDAGVAYINDNGGITADISMLPMDHIGFDGKLYLNQPQPPKNEQQNQQQPQQY